MARNNTESETGKTSMADVAKMLLTPVQKPEEEANTQGELDLGDDTQEVVEETVEDVEDDVEAEDSPTGGDEEVDEVEEEAEVDESDEEEADETDYLDVRDDDLITVMVDGEEQEVSIGDLKKAHSGEGAIEKRLQEATEARKAAHAERTQLLEKIAQDEAVTMQALESLDESVFAPIIPQPSADLQRSDPSRYINHLNAYNEDQARIAEAKSTVEKKKREILERRQARLKDYGEYAASEIVKQIPELGDSEKSDKMLKTLTETAMSYGYTQQEISNALDPRMFMLVRDAMKYRELQGKAKTGNPKDLEGQKAKKVRRLRSGNTQAKTRVAQKDKQRQEVRERARKSGKLSDVAALIRS